MKNLKTYIGHGVYADFDGANVVLWTGGIEDPAPSNRIVLNPDAVESFMIYVNMIRDAKSGE